MDDNDDDFNVIERAEDTYAREAVDDNLLYRNNVDDDIDPSNTISRKRPMKIEECDQLDWHLRISLEDESAQKRIAQEIETDRALQELANRILTARKKRRSTKQGSDQVYSMCSPSSSNDTSQVILLQPPLDGTPWIGLSSTDNHRRFYVRIRPKTQRPSSANPANGDLTGMRKTGFNEKSIEKILELVQSSCHCDTSAMMMHAETVVMCEGIDVFKKPGTVTDQLWVDKYAPKNYFDLLSNEINRTLLHWLKLWDLCVFQKSVTQLTKNTNNDITLDDGRPRRPVHKLTLLSGSPGVGKTTLASIIVMHCGYRFINVNASDERTVEDFQKCIEGALRSVRTLDLAHSPNCLIIDEIDGAPADSIKYLCKILNATGRQAIRRPVICICNNLYEKSLRELRAMALVLRVQSIEKRCLIKRLEMIARFERVPIEYSALSMIANIVDGDVRLAINSLQFIAADYELSEITCDVVQKYNDREGFMKNKSIFDAWATVFDLNRHPGVRGRLEQMTCRAERVSAIYQQFYGESDRFFLGLFTNYLATSPGTTRMSEIRAVSSYFCDYDLLIKHVLHHQNYSLMKYSYVPCVQMHYLLASVNRIHLDFPTYDQIVNQRQKQSVELLNSVKGDSLRGTMSVEVTLLDFLPLIVMIVQPPLKPMNFQMYSAYELNILHSIVATMRFYCLDYRTEHSDGISCYKFFPRIEYLAYFPLHGMGNERICYCLANSARQMISNEVVLRQQFQSLPIMVVSVRSQIGLVRCVYHGYQAALVVYDELDLQRFEEIRDIIRHTRMRFGEIFEYLIYLANSLPPNKRMRNLGKYENVTQFLSRLVLRRLSNYYLIDVRIQKCTEVMIAGDDVDTRLEVVARIESACKNFLNNLENADSETKRIAFTCTFQNDLFYQEKAFYGRQDKLDRTITRICDLIGISRTMSNVLSAAKGMVVGSLSITDGSNFVDCSMAPFIITHFSHTSQFHTDAEFILVVEKDTVFQRLLHEGFFQIFSKSILVTGRGYPDALTRLFLQKIMSVHHLPLFGLMDSDPYGVEIAMIYKYGAKKQTTEMGDLSLPSFYWIGISQAESDLLRHPIGPDQFLPLSKTDLKKIKNLMERAKTLNDSRFFEELRRMNENGTKLEIEAISGIAPGYVCEFIKPLIYR